MPAGGVAWMAANLAWGAGLPAASWTAGWAAFLVLTIVGERLELSRLARLPRLAWIIYGVLLVLHGAAAVLSLAAPLHGFRLTGLVLVGWALWLGRYDIARRTVRGTGLPRFAAVALLAGYAWLGVAGLLWLTSPRVPAGLRWDVEVHALFLGFVFSMVFAHAPIIWSSVLGGEIRFSPRFYGHLLLLHLSLLLRVGADLAAWEAGRRWAAMLNTLAVLLFLGKRSQAVTSFTPRPRPPCSAEAPPHDRLLDLQDSPGRVDAARTRPPPACG